MNEESLFAEALLKNGEVRAAFLGERCKDDAELRARLEALLWAADNPDPFLEAPAPAQAATAAEPPAGESPGAVVGCYKLIERVGEGGMGSVWMAQQQEPVRRLVALKLIKAGMDSRQVVARFEAERQALALMDHPNIARVLDGGTTEGGRPFFVMELVKGTPITTFCDERKLTPRQRLELFVPVCQAIQHAHQKGIIHRDIKPSNVLVTLYDGVPVPKVIDFGVAKAVGQALTEQTLVTGFGAIVGTLEYMSPEQAEVNALDVDTRSDVYSLGVLLYELLAGSPPFTRKELGQGGVLEMLRVIREQEPTKPSTKLSTDEGLPTLAANRGTEPAKVTRMVRGELDWIVMKALEKDRNRRYETANGFAADIQRYLSDEPVQACPPSAWYRLCKFARRNKAALAVVGVIAGALVTAVVALAVSNWLVARERDQKTQALSDKEKALTRESAALGKARVQDLLARRRLNASQMNLAMQAWRAGEVPRVLELLEGQRPQADEEDLRGFEWFYLWRLCNGGRRAPIQGHTTAAMSLAFSPDGRTLASASWDRTLRLWDTATGKEQKVLRGHSKWVWEVAFSPDGKTLASGGYETGSMILWDVGTGRPLHTIAGSVMGLRFTPDGKAVVGGLVNGKAIDCKEWDVASGAERATIADAGIVVGLVPASKTLVTLAGRYSPRSELRFWDTASGARRSTISEPYIQSATLSPDGTRVATSTVAVKVWDTATGKQQSVYPTDSTARGLAFSPDGKKLAAGLEDRRVIVWDVATGAQLGQYVHLDGVWAVAFSPDGKTLASGTLGGAIKLWDMTPAEEATTIADVDATIGGRLGAGRCVRFSPDGRTLLVGNKGLTKLIDVVAGKEIAVLPVSSAMAISADASVLAGRANRDEYDLWDVRAGRKFANISLPAHVTEVPPFTLSPDGKTLAGYRAWLADNTVTLRDVPTQQSKTLKIAPPESNRLSVVCADFSPDGKLLAAGFQFQWVTVWHVDTGKVKLQFSQKPAMMSVMSVAFSPCGKTLAVGTDVGTVTLWDLDTGKRLVAFRGHTSWVLALAFSPDGHTLATAGSDKTVRLWDVITGQERSTLTGHTGAVHSVSFSPDGYTLATASVDGTVKLRRGATDPEALAPRSDPFRGRNADSLALPRGAIELTPAGLSRAIALEPNNPTYHYKLGAALDDLGKADEALESYGKAIELKLQDADARNNLSKRMLRRRAALDERAAASPRSPRECGKLISDYFRLGRLLTAAGKHEEAEAAYRKGLAVRDQLEKDFAGKAEFRRDLADTHYDVGHVVWEAGRTDDCVKSFQMALSHAQQWVDAEPRSRDARNRLARTHCDLAGIYRWATRQFDGSEKAARQALVLFDELAVDFPREFEFSRLAAECVYTLATVEFVREQYPKAEELGRQAIARYEKLLGWPDQLRDNVQLALAENRLGMTELYLARTLAHRDRPGEAAESFERAVALVRKSRQNPIVARLLGHELRECRGFYALFLAESGRPDEAEKQFRQDLEPSDAHWRNELAWRLAAHPTSRVRNASAGLAVKLAREAADVAPNDATIARTLGTALYRAGRWKAAIAALEKSRELRNGGDSFDWFFLAMAHWQFGEKDQAREWYERAVPWMDKNQPKNEELRRFRAESAELLELKEKK